MFERYDYDIYKLESDDIYTVKEVYVGTGNHVIDVLELVVFYGLALLLAVLLVTAAMREHRNDAARAECAKRWDCSVADLKLED